MKHLLLTALLATSASAFANHPDSVYVRPDSKNGTRDFKIAYSIDKKHWTRIECNLFESDYGTWGSEKKLFYPVLSYEKGLYKATFIPNLNNGQIATTCSEDFALWKPQDYPYIDKEKFKDVVEQQKKASENNIIRIPYSGLEALLAKQIKAQANGAKERIDFISEGKSIASNVKDITMKLDVNLNDSKAISPDLMGIFFEDISYAADGGLYAELIQNRDFEYSSDDRREWNSLTAWKLDGEGTTWSIGTNTPIHKNNPHYLVLNTTSKGAKVTNEGWDGIAIKEKAKYNLSLFARGIGAIKVSLVENGEYIASTVIKASDDWKQHKAVLTASKSAAKAQLVIEPIQAGSMHIDFISLMPKDTYKGHANGLRRDLAETIADLHPKFVRFPGGCATHGQGIDNIYHWQATVGELWERQPDMNIWSYHQTRGLGFHEYFQFCEDMGAEPLPVLAAGVPCQNSWKGGAGQQGGIPFEKDLNGKPSAYTYNGKPLTMESYLQELLDLIEWANGDAKTSPLAQIRAKAGHPAPFNMKYLGIGNEDLISDVFLERYLFLIDGIKKAHPEITVVGTVGPFWEGSDYEYGWREAKKHNIEVVDEHYYNSPSWYFSHRDFYDNYDRKGTKVYLGEWASKGNNVTNALVEAAYLTNVERNADVVIMSSYAPLLAKEGHTSWNPDLIYFNNTEIKPTANYYVQRAFGQNAGDEYIYSDLSVSYSNASENRNSEIGKIKERIDKSVVRDSKTGDINLKFVSLLPKEAAMTVNLGQEDIMKDYLTTANMDVLASEKNPNQRNWEVNETKTITIGNQFEVKIPAYSVVTIKIKKNSKKK